MVFVYSVCCCVADIMISIRASEIKVLLDKEPDAIKHPGYYCCLALIALRSFISWIYQLNFLNKAKLQSKYKANLPLGE